MKMHVGSQSDASNVVLVYISWLEMRKTKLESKFASQNDLTTVTCEYRDLGFGACSNNLMVTPRELPALDANKIS